MLPLLLLLLLLLFRAGLDVLLSDFSVVGCHSSTWAAKYHSELGAAVAMFKAGYSIDSLLIRCVAMDSTAANKAGN
jgi:hypothetical protein